MTIAFHTTVVGWNEHAREGDVDGVVERPEERASCRRPSPAASSSVELSTPNATLQTLSKVKRLRTSCRSITGLAGVREEAEAGGADGPGGRVQRSGAAIQLAAIYPWRPPIRLNFFELSMFLFL